MKSQSKTSADLREMLFRQMEAIQNGEAEPITASPLCKLSSEIIKTVKLEMEYAREIGRRNGDGFSVEPIVLTIAQDASIEAKGSRAANKSPGGPFSLGAGATTRHCLKCRRLFQSEGAGNRVCEKCSAQNASQSEDSAIIAHAAHDSNHIQDTSQGEK